ncbi:MAG: protein-L-isoaspartate(D-aspartate) O-methyltransferase [Planctomycetota bacterium]
MNFSAAAQRMVETQIIARGINDIRVIRVFQKVPRHLFVQPEDINQAYEDRPLPIRHGQTISQPFMVAYMLEQLLLKGCEKVLEIGTGSGYQTALLSELAGEIYTIERIPELLESARQRLNKMDIKNVFYKIADGTLGWPEKKFFDRIIVSAGGPKVPEVLVEQLSDGGFLLIPVGDEFCQELVRVRRQDNKTSTENLGSCVFVRLIGKQGWKEE